MLPVKTEMSNAVLKAEGCADLPVNYGNDMYISTWELSDEELAIVKKTKRVNLYIFGQTHPPACITASEEL